MRRKSDRFFAALTFVCAVWGVGQFLEGTTAAAAEGMDDPARHAIGWGWQERPHGQTLASDLLGQLVEGDPARPNFGGYGVYGGPKPYAFSFFAFNAGRYQIAGGLAAHQGVGKLAVPDYWNQRVLLFDLREDGSLASRTASGLIGQARYDEMEIGRGPSGLHYPSACAFDPSGEHLFVADEYNHRVLQFRTNDPTRAMRVFGQRDFDRWGNDASEGALMWDSTREDVRGPKLVRDTGNVGFFLPRGVACDDRRLFVSDCDNHRVLAFDLAGEENGPEAVAVLGQQDFAGHDPNRGGPPTLRTMLFPGGLAVDPSHRYLLVADSLNSRVLIFDIAGPIENGMEAVAAVPLPDWRPQDQPNPPFERRIAGATAVAVNRDGQVFVSDRTGIRVAMYRLEDMLSGGAEPLAAIGRFEMSTDLWQVKPGYVGPTGLAAAGDYLYVAEPRGNRVLCFDAGNPTGRAVDLLGQFYGNDVSRPHFNKYGPNNGPDPYGLDFSDGTPALSVSEDGQWLLAADPIGGRLLFFPLARDGLPLDRSARLALGVPSLDSRANSFGPGRFNRAGHSLWTSDGRLFASDFQGSRIMYFELPQVADATGGQALKPPRAVPPPEDRPFRPREEFDLRSIDSGQPALHVLGQVDFYTGLRDTASNRQMSKEISGLAYDRERDWLFVAEKLSHRVVIVDVRQGVETYMAATAVLGQPDFEQNAPNWGQAEWHPRGMVLPSSVCYDHATETLFVVSGEGREREILGFDLSETPENGAEPVLRIGGAHATVESDLPRVERLLALDEERRRLWSGLFALDLSGDVRTRLPLVGWFGLGPDERAEHEQENHTGRLPNLLGYSVGFCDRFGGAVGALAVNPATGTVYVSDTPRYRVLCFQPQFAFRRDGLTLRNGAPACEVIGTGGLAPLRFSLVSGELPSGMAMDVETGILRGTPRAAPDSYEVEVAASTATGDVRGRLRIELLPQ